MQSKSVIEIRRLGVTKVNRLVRAHRHLEELRQAFAEWQAGEIYICKKTATYRYRFGAQSKSVAPWSNIAKDLFATVAEFALAAVVLGPELSNPEPKEKPAPAPATPASSRANVIALAHAA